MDREFHPRRQRRPVKPAKLEMGLPRHLAAGSIARREIGRCFADRLAEMLVVDLLLVANELVTNAVVHGVGEIRLIVQSMPDHVRVEVIDDGDGFMVPVDPTSDKGLAIVDQLADRWGVQVAGSTHVWCYLATGAPQPLAARSNVGGG